MPKPITVAIVDDDTLVRTLLTQILAAKNIVVSGQAADGSQAVELITKTRPDVVIMDIRMQKMSGIEATRLVTAMDDPPGVLALTSFDSRAIILDAIDAGVTGFLAKDASPTEIVEAIRLVSEGEGVLSPRATRIVLDEMQSSPKLHETLDAKKRLLTLSKREKEVTRLVAQGLSNQEIAQKIFLSETTVKTHIAAALAKTGANNRVQLAVLAVSTSPEADTQK